MDSMSYAETVRRLATHNAYHDIKADNNFVGKDFLESQNEQIRAFVNMNAMMNAIEKSETIDGVVYDNFVSYGFDKFPDDYIWNHAREKYAMNDLHKLLDADFELGMDHRKEVFDHIKKIGRERTSALSMREQLIKLLGPKARALWDQWQKDGLISMHIDLTPEGRKITGEDYAELLMSWNNAPRTLVENVDSELTPVKPKKTRKKAK